MSTRANPVALRRRTILFGATYKFTDALKVINDPEVILELKASNKPGLIKSGNDFLYGQNRDDWIYGGADVDYCDGGLGVDTNYLAACETAVNF